MPAAKQRAASSSSRSRGRSSSNGSSRATSKPRQRTAAKKSSANGASASSKASETARSTASSNGQSQDSHRTIASIGMSAAAGALGVAGGVLLGRTAFQRNRKFLGVKLPVKVDLTDVSKQVGEAGRQFGKLAGEMNAVRKKAEQLGKAIS